MWHDSWGGWWIVMPLLWLTLWAAVIWAVATAVRGRSDSKADTSASSTTAARPRRPEEVLADRYARGEIDEDEYRRRLDILKMTTHRPG